MDRAVVDRAVQALAALNTATRPEAQTRTVTEPQRERKIGPEPRHAENQAACGSPHCAGCYEVEPGVRIHPPKSGKDWVQ